MRSEQEILNLILDTAQQDERIRAVVLNGSRANPNAPRDFFQDFDVVFFVEDVAPFWKNLEWIQRFGELMILQMPEDMEDPPPDRDGNFIYLMQFMDGSRIDLGINPLDMIDEVVSDSLSIVLLDKDGRIPPLPPSNEGDYLPKPPTAKAFEDCCNEFWWTSISVAKGLWRGEILYARYFLDNIVREQFMKMLYWYIGMTTGFSRNPGKFGKYVQQYLEPERWERLLKTYPDASCESTWDALFTIGGFFREIALEVASEFGFEYPHGDDERVSAHLARVRSLLVEAEGSDC